MPPFEADDSLMLNDNRRTRSDAIRNHTLLLETARTLFEQQGVDAVSMSQIAQAAGVGKGTLYRNFENKIDLCYALLDQDQRELQSETLQRLRAHQDPCDAYNNLCWFVEHAARFVMRNENLLYAGADSLQAVALELPAHMWWRQTIRNLLNQLNFDGDPDYASDTLYIMLHVNTIRFQKHAPGYTNTQIIDGLLDMVDRLLRV